jgi:hypothetical protein
MLHRPVEIAGESGHRQGSGQLIDFDRYRLQADFS